ncbi:MAG: sodium:proton antiporter [Verrucomicrobiota bacterium]|jgi:Na+/H+ antiporter NhaD/arsenite permease-like protein
MMLPFGLLLAAMALGPVLLPQWWQKHYGEVASALGAVTVGCYLLILPSAAAQTVVRTGYVYLGFIAMMGSLFVVSGGIHLNLGEETTPAANVAFLLAGALLANLVGTVGASLLLIRPWLRCNEQRLRAYHVIFFIFIISNVGGCLTPFGNPPLFLGCLMGVPLWWVTEHCWPMWLCGVGFLLAVFYSLDRRNARCAAAPPPSGPRQPWRVEGMWNLVFLAVILGAVFVPRPLFLREGLMLAAAAASWFTTGKAVHQANHFDFHPIREVAVLFLGIFATMMPALDWLQTNARMALGADPSPALVYWSSGALSSLLDNAPAYLSFLGALFGAQGQGLGHPAEMKQILDAGHLGQSLAALSVAAVFFGGCSYIGNGPNLMVKAIAERRQAALPGFLGYIFKWTLPVMLPLLIGIWLIFFR